MRDGAPYELIDGIKCYNSEVCKNYENYPQEGFNVTEEINKGSFWSEARNKLLLMLVKNYRPATRPTRFLELGCANGHFLKSLSTEYGFESIGSEVYLDGLLYAKNEVTTAEFIQLDATSKNMPFADHFDSIGAFDVIEHIDDDTTALKNVFGMLKDNGFFLVTVPQYQFMWSRLDEIVKHKRRYSKRELALKLESVGFTIERSTSFVFLLFPLMLVSRILDRIKTRNDAHENEELNNYVAFSKFTNWIFYQIMRIDIFLIRCGISLPFGGTLVIIAKKH